MDRRSFLALTTATLTGLLLPSAGLALVPRVLVASTMGECSFCRKSASEVPALLGNRSHSTSICSECIRLCVDIVRENVAPSPSPSPSPPPRREDWKRALIEAGYSEEELERLILGKPRPRRTRRDLHCSFCDQSQREVAKLVAGPQVYICDGCVVHGGSMLHWAGVRL